LRERERDEDPGTSDDVLAKNGTGWDVLATYYLRIYLFFFKKIHYLFTSKVKKKIDYFISDFFFLLKYN
jgi:hypothetical protein